MALHRETPHPVRVTHGADHFVPASRSAGRWLAFVSNQDLLGNGSTGQQIFLYDHQGWVCQHGEPNADTLATCNQHSEPVLRQITSGVGQPDNPSVDQDGKRVVFDAWGSFDGGADVNRRQVFYIELSTMTVHRVTNFASGGSDHAQLSPGGLLMAFETTGLTCAQAPGVKQLAFYELQTGEFRIATCGKAPSTKAQFADSGGLMAFESRADLLGDGHDTGVNQIFFATIDRRGENRTIVPTIYQLTKGNAPSIHSYLSSDGSTIVFESTATNLRGVTGANGTPEIFSGPTDSGNLPLITQYTTPSVFGTCTYPTIDSISSKHVLFICDGDPLQNGTTGNRVFLLDTSRDPNEVWQLTARGNVKGPISASMGQWFVIISTEEDMAGDGNCGHQIYVVDYYPDRYVAARHPGEIPPAINPGNPDAACEDGNPCSADACNGNNQCSHVPTSGNDCSLLCGTVGICNAGECRGSVTTCDDSDPCTTDSCDPNEGCKHEAASGDCYACAVGNQCKDQNSCTTEACTNDVCKTTTLPNGSPCDTDRCIDNQSCASGQCGGGQDKNCDDGDPCTDEICDSESGCGHVQRPNCRGCAQDTDCTTGNQCTRGWCVNNPNGPVPPKVCLYVNEPNFTTCNDGNPLNCKDYCLNGSCQSMTPDDCDDKNPCTDDSCSATGCLNTPIPGCVLCNDDAGCDDGNGCTVDKCYNGVCANKPQAEGSACIATPGDVCGSVGVCTAGVCANPIQRVCDDGVSCTTDTCDPVEGCSFAPNNAPCDDGNACTNDFCHPVLGCVHEPIVCDDGNGCTDDACDPIGGCFFTNNTAQCSDGDACTVGDTCSGGSCQSGGPATCDDGSLCTTDSCDPIGGCVFTPTVVCTDNDACNGLETCDPGTGTCVAGVSPNCDDGDLCTTDTCDAQAGCVHQLATDTASVLCNLRKLQGDLETAISANAISTRKLRAKLRGQIARTIAQIETADRASGQYRRKHLRNGSRLLGRFLVLMQKATAKAACTPITPTCQGLMDTGNAIGAALAPLTRAPN